MKVQRVVSRSSSRRSGAAARHHDRRAPWRYHYAGATDMSETQTTADLNELQAKINAFWSWRGNAIASGGLAIRDEAELKTWMELLRDWLPPAPADVVDLGTGQGFL